MNQDLANLTVERAQQHLAGRGELLCLAFAGSHLFGVATPKSDLDFKGLYMPKRENLYLAHPNAADAVNVHDPQHGVDAQIHSVQQWISMLAKGDTNALTLLFAMRQDDVTAHLSDRGRAWRDRMHPQRLVKHGLDGMLAYLRSQAHRYSAKGDRLKILRRLYQDLPDTVRGMEFFGGDLDAGWERYRREVLEPLAGPAALSELWLERKPNPNNGGEQIFLVAFGKRYDLKSKGAMARQMLQANIDDYGKRTREAELQGLDLKAWYHSFRVAYEALELAETGFLTYPRPEAAFLMDIRRGLYTPRELDELYQPLFAQAQELRRQAHGPSHAFDQAYADELVLALYQDPTPTLEAARAA